MRVFIAMAAAAAALAACTKAPIDDETGPAQDALGVEKYSSTALQTMGKAADGADGSGCLADAGDLPDGAWFGFAPAWDAAGIDFDPACFFTGEEAAKEAASRGEESPPPNDFFIVNDAVAVRRVPVAEGVAALRITHDKDGGVTQEQTTFADLVAQPGTYLPCPGEICPVWIYVNGGAVTEVQMQYLP
jgi:hypothetical protein